MDKYDFEVYNALTELEIPAHMLGYEQIKTAMQLIHENPKLIHAVTKELYPAIAKIYDTKPSRVERNIRFAQEHAYADVFTRKKVLGTDRPLTNARFLATLNEAIKIRLAE